MPPVELPVDTPAREELAVLLTERVQGLPVDDQRIVDLLRDPEIPIAPVFEGRVWLIGPDRKPRGFPFGVGRGDTSTVTRCLTVTKALRRRF